MLRILLVATLIAAALFAVKDQRVLQRAGLLGSCRAVTAPAADGAEWHVCRDGKLSGRPDLSLDSCTSYGIVRGLEYWRCPAPLSAGRAPRP